MESACHRAARPLAEGRSHSHQQAISDPSQPPSHEGSAAAELQAPQWIWSLTDPDPGCVTPGNFLDLSEPPFHNLQHGQQEREHYTTVSRCFYFRGSANEEAASQREGTGPHVSDLPPSCFSSVSRHMEAPSQTAPGRVFIAK